MRGIGGFFSLLEVKRRSIVKERKATLLHLYVGMMKNIEGTVEIGRMDVDEVQKEKKQKKIMERESNMVVTLSSEQTIKKKNHNITNR